MPKEHPILFSKSMVKAILQGAKTQTRRVMKPQIADCNHSIFTEAEWNKNPTEWVIKYGFAYCGLCGNGVTPKGDYSGIKCPYGMVGDILWVRETFEVHFCNDGGDDYTMLHYISDNSWTRLNTGMKAGKHPSIHMPRIASRILLEITHIKIERLQDISPEDACDEGIEYDNIDLDAFEGGELVADFKNYTWKDDASCEDYHFPTFASCIESYRTLWQKINGKDSWNENPWVWVIEFKIINHS